MERTINANQFAKLHIKQIRDYKQKKTKTEKKNKLKTLSKKKNSRSEKFTKQVITKNTERRANFEQMIQHNNDDDDICI